MTDFEPRGEHLEKIGFKRIGASDLHVQGEFAVEIHPDGASNLLINYSDSINWMDVVALKKGTEKGYFSLMTLTSKGHFCDCTPSGGGSFGGQAPPGLKTLRGTLTDQLLAAGFVKDENEPNIYRNTVEYYKEKVALVAVTENNKIQKIYMPIRKEAAELLGNNFQIIGLKKTTNKWDSPIDIVDVENDHMRFQISSSIGGRIVDESQKLLRQITEQELGIKPFPIEVEDSGFKIGGVNSTELIRKLDKINGQKISRLEERMRPHSSSMSGFLGQNESLVEILADDNDFVLNKGLTHQDLAKILIYAREHVLGGAGENFTLEGCHFQIKYAGWRGMQSSPFEDGTGTSIDMTVMNLDNGKKLKCSGLVPDMVQRYGFYEGKGTSYRLEPQAVIDVFDFISHKPQQSQEK